MERGVDEACAAFYGKKNQAPIFGDELFREQIRGYLSADSDDNEVPEKRYLNKLPSIETIMDVCARHCGVKMVFLSHSLTNRGVAALSAMLINGL